MSPLLLTSGEFQRPRLLVLGLGNDLLSDDGVGLRLVAKLRDRFSDCPNVTFRESTEMGLSLLDLVTGYEEVVLVDAIQTGSAPVGYLHEFEVHELQVLPGSSPHFAGVGEMLALGRELGIPMPARVRVIAIEVEDPVTVSYLLTPRLEAEVPLLVDLICSRLMAELRSDPLRVSLQLPAGNPEATNLAAQEKV